SAAAGPVRCERRAARPPPGLAGRGRARTERRLDLAHRRLARARGIRLDGDPDRGPPESAPDPDGRRLGRPSPAQGLSDRRRAGPLLGRRVIVERPKIYEGSRIPRIPTVLEISDEEREAGDILTI